MPCLRCVATGLEAYLIERDFAAAFVEHCSDPRSRRQHIDHVLVSCTSRIYAPPQLLCVQEPTCSCCKKAPEIMHAMHRVASMAALVMPVAIRPPVMPELYVCLTEERDFGAKRRRHWVQRMELKAIGAVMATLVLIVVGVTWMANRLSRRFNATTPPTPPTPQQSINSAKKLDVSD